MLRAPRLLTADHTLGAFDSRVPSLDDWLRRCALLNQASRASRTFVVCDARAVIAHYALTASAVAPTTASGRFKRNMQDPIPVVLLARLAIERVQQGCGLGRTLFQDAAHWAYHLLSSRFRGEGIGLEPQRHQTPTPCRHPGR